MASSAPAETLHFPSNLRALVDPHLPPTTTTNAASTTLSSPPPEQAFPADPFLPWITLTFATSLDSQLSLAPGTQTHLSGPGSKAMTHYLRSRHAAILIGAGTARADDPALNCRLDTLSFSSVDEQPRPIVVGDWDFGTGEDQGEEVESCVYRQAIKEVGWIGAKPPRPLARVLRLAREGRGKAPWIVTGAPSSGVPERRRRFLEELGGRYIHLRPEREGLGVEHETLGWRTVFGALREEGVGSVMVGGGGAVVNEMLRTENAEMVDSVIVTVAPVWLGQGGVVVSPPRRKDGNDEPVAALRLKEAKWQQMGEDVVLCGKVK